jgi:2-dehydro-3-deoxyphosphogluconate aldolase/(4S)-4-hydroxy-2-oxoglutarate aldolase
MKVEVTLKELIRRRLVAVLHTKTPEQALAVAEAVGAGGILSLEIPMTIPDAVEVIKTLTRRPGFLVGAGGVLMRGQAEAALKAGARFLISPMGELSLIPLCREAGVVSVIGGFTPTEIMTARHAGADMVKVFPLESVGGPRFLQELVEPFPDLPLMISGNISIESLPDYLGFPHLVIALGSSLVIPRLVSQGRYATITERAHQWVIFVEKRRG